MAKAIDLLIDDEVTVAEIRLVTDLMMVAVGAPGRLEQDVIDAALGVEQHPRTFPRQRRNG
jgi:hypothetical protein